MQVFVIGGGVIGSACAYYLHGQGCSVIIADRGEFGQGCSHGNCGFICPSHVLPLAEPGAIGRALRALCSRNSPFSIRPRLDWTLWSWLWKFARRCNERDMLAAAHACAALLNSSLSLYRGLMEAEPFDCDWETRGLLFAFRDPRAFAAYGITNTLLSETFGHPATRYAGDDVLRLEPALRPGLAGGWHYEADAHLRPDKLMSSWQKILVDKGVQVVEQCEVLGFAERSGRAIAVQTNRGEFAADAFVVATGALAPRLAPHLGCRLPIQPGKGYSLTMPRPQQCPTIPLIFPETRVAVTPWKSGYRLGSTMEFAGYDTTLSPRRLEMLRSGAQDYLVEPWCEPVLESWYGWRPMTYDSLPIIDRSPKLPNVMIATGHNMLGVSMSPATGKLVAELLTERPPHIDPHPYRVSRF